MQQVPLWIGRNARGDPPVWGLRKGLTTPHSKKPACYEICRALEWKNRSGSLKTAASKLAKHKLDLLQVLLISLTSVMNIPNSIRILYNISLLTASQTFSKSINTEIPFHYSPIFFLQYLLMQNIH
jgi:hypothetical protein